MSVQLVWLTIPSVFDYHDFLKGNVTHMPEVVEFYIFGGQTVGRVIRNVYRLYENDDL